MLLFVCLLTLTAMAVGEETSVSELFKEANSQFTTNMFTEVVKQSPEKSVVISGYSVLAPFAQLGLASVGESHDDILRVIGLPNDNVTKAAFLFTNEQLRSTKGITLKTANAIYIADGYKLNNDFATLSKQVFESEVKSANFLKKQETANEINSWVEDHTNHLIKDLAQADSFDSDTRAVLVNAIYFKGSWWHKFDKKNTENREFHISKGTTVKVPTMYISQEFFYAESAELDAKLLELPYEGNEASFTIILPNQIDGLDALEEKLKDSAAVFKAVSYMYKAKVDVYLPKFKIESTTDLKDVLTKLGAGNLFDSSKARLDNLLDGESGLFVSEAVQKAVIEINEEGAEAAAANEFVALTRSFKTIRTVQFVADRPFFYFLKCNDIELFSGVYHP